MLAILLCCIWFLDHTWWVQGLFLTSCLGITTGGVEGRYYGVLGTKLDWLHARQAPCPLLHLQVEVIFRQGCKVGEEETVDFWEKFHMGELISSGRVLRWWEWEAR